MSEDSSAAGTHDVPVLMRCECGASNCRGFVPICIEDYEYVRSFPRRFVLRDGHAPVLEKSVVRQGSDYVIVEAISRASAA